MFTYSHTAATAELRHRRTSKLAVKLAVELVAALLVSMAEEVEVAVAVVVAVRSAQQRFQLEWTLLVLRRRRR